MGGLASTDGARGHAPELAGAVDWALYSVYSCRREFQLSLGNVELVTSIRNYDMRCDWWCEGGTLVYIQN